MAFQAVCLATVPNYFVTAYQPRDIQQISNDLSLITALEIQLYLVDKDSAPHY
jgi:hypothetical protein